MPKVYLPNELLDYPCKVINNQDTIYVYTSTQENVYQDYYVVYPNSHYLYKKMNGRISSFNSCDNINTYTSDFYYRNDLDSILLIFIIIFILCFYFPYKLFSRLLGRWFKC